MIDIHTHILPKVDDGARSLEEATELVRKSIENGVSKIILTTHFISGTYNKEYNDVHKLFTVFKKKIEENFMIEVLLSQKIFY